MNRFINAFDWAFFATLIAVVVINIMFGFSIYWALVAGVIVGVLRYINPKPPPKSYEE